MAAPRKKLIEVSIPLEAINAASAHEKMPGIGPHPRGIHLWWARRPLAACRAVLFAQLVDDPSSWPDKFPTEEQQDAERKRLHKIIERLVPWEASNDEPILNEVLRELTERATYLYERVREENNGPREIRHLRRNALHSQNFPAAFNRGQRHPTASNG